jgi:hypothetical protein
MSARSKIVRDRSGQEVAIPYDPRDDAPNDKGTQHTPGPWTTYTTKTSHVVMAAHRMDGTTIANVRYKGQVDEANAALIAAAPETAAERDRLRQVNEVMLEALRGVAGWVDPKLDPLAGVALNKARAAIAAAEGK